MDTYYSTPNLIVDNNYLLYTADDADEEESEELGRGVKNKIKVEGYDRRVGMPSEKNK